MIRGHHRSDASAPTRAQIGFFWVVVLHLTERGVMDVDLLDEPRSPTTRPTGSTTCLDGWTAGPAAGVA